LKIKCNYVNGKIEGECLIYYDNGQLECKCIRVNGKIEGKYLEYYENGNIRYIKQYINNVCISTINKDGLIIVFTNQLEKYVFNEITCDNVCLICKF